MGPEWGFQDVGSQGEGKWLTRTFAIPKSATRCHPPPRRSGWDLLAVRVGARGEVTEELLEVKFCILFA